jgi:hypothetical protein
MVSNLRINHGSLTRFGDLTDLTPTNHRDREPTGLAFHTQNMAVSANQNVALDNLGQRMQTNTLTGWQLLTVSWTWYSDTGFAYVLHNHG